MDLSGHYWTLAAQVSSRVRGQTYSGEAWSAEFDDPVMGLVGLCGILHTNPQAESIVVLVHGLGGSPESLYLPPIARELVGAGFSCLRLGLRGADRSGSDFYHAGLTQDLKVALASPQLSRYKRIYLLGVSLGGHVSLRLATEEHDPRLSGVLTVCAPLNLSLTSQNMDSPWRLPYRSYILRSLIEIYGELAKRREQIPTPLPRIKAVRSLREWDALTVVPRFGFASVDEYYRSMSVGDELHKISLPVLFVASRHDPMVTANSLQESLASRPPNIELHWAERGGHVAFPRNLKLGFSDKAGLPAQLAAWLRAREASSPVKTQGLS